MTWTSVYPPSWRKVTETELKLNIFVLCCPYFCIALLGPTARRVERNWHSQTWRAEFHLCLNKVCLFVLEKEPNFAAHFKDLKMQSHWVLPKITHKSGWREIWRFSLLRLFLPLSGVFPISNSFTEKLQQKQTKKLLFASKSRDLSMQWNSKLRLVSVMAKGGQTHVIWSGHSPLYELHVGNVHSIRLWLSNGHDKFSVDKGTNCWSFLQKSKYFRDKMIALTLSSVLKIITL